MVKDVFLIRNESRLTIVPAIEGLQKILTYDKKVMEPDPERPWIRRIRKVKRPAFKIKEGFGKDPDAIMTFPGFWKRVYEYLIKNGYKPQIKDLRQTFPKPMLSNMHGFRFSQYDLLTKFLAANDSGLLGAPTRYGKTTLIINTLRAYPNLCTVVTAPGKDLIKQLYEDIKRSIPDREVILLGAGSKKRFSSDQITVCSMDSLDKCDTGKTRLLLIDEPHAAVTDSRLPVIDGFDNARRFGYGATLTGRFDNRDVLIEGLIGPVLAERTYLEAVAEGAICPLTVIMLNVTIGKGDFNPGWRRDKAYKNILFENPRIANIIRKICLEVIPESWQTILFIRNEKQADFLLDYVGKEGTIAMAKKLTDKERVELMERMKDDDIKRCLASDIYSQGVTFSYVRAMVNVGGGGANTTTIQKPGRLAEVMPDKRCGVVFDIKLTPADNVDMNSMGESKMLVIDSEKRHQAYLDKGYKVIDVYSFADLLKAFKEECL